MLSTGKTAKAETDRTKENANNISISDNAAATSRTRHRRKKSRTAWDGFICQLLMSDNFARRALQQLLPAPLLDIADLHSLSLASEKLPPESGKKHTQQMDIVYLIETRQQDGHLLVHLEHQSSHDPRIEKRIASYRASLRQRYRNSPEGRGREPLIFSILLYHGKTRQQPLHWMERLTSTPMRHAARALHGNLTKVVDISAMDDQQITAMGVLAPVSLVLRDLNCADLADLLPRLLSLMEHTDIALAEQQMIIRFAMYYGKTQNLLAVRQLAASRDNLYGETIMVFTSQIERLFDKVEAYKYKTEVLKNEVEQRWLAGLAVGQKNALSQTAVNMLNKGIGDDTILECTGISQQELDALRTQHRH